MKIDRSKLKKSSSEVPADCKNLIDKLKVGKTLLPPRSVKLNPVIFLRAALRISFFGS